MIQKQIVNYDNYEVYNKLNHKDLIEALNEAKIRLEREKKLVDFLNSKVLKNNKKSQTIPLEKSSIFQKGLAAIQAMPEDKRKALEESVLKEMYGENHNV